jgi:hypothetical protein
MTQEQQHSITPLDDLAQPWLSDNYTVREIRAARAMAVSPSEVEQAFATPWSSSTTNSSPITPPPELVRQWTALANEEDGCKVWNAIATQAAQWGADQQLDTCCKSLDDIPGGWGDSRHLRHVCRPKPPSLKEQALALLDQHEEGWRPSPKDWDTIRTAIEALPND